MTDMELTKRCAETMEPQPTLPGSSKIWGCATTFKNGEVKRTSWVRSTYDPLHDDAQAMALVKRGFISTIIKIGGTGFYVVSAPYAEGNVAHDADLSRAICLCVARMQKGK